MDKDKQVSKIEDGLYDGFIYTFDTLCKSLDGYRDGEVSRAELLLALRDHIAELKGSAEELELKVEEVFGKG